MIPFIINVQNRQINRDKKQMSGCQGLGAGRISSDCLMDEKVCLGESSGSRYQRVSYPLQSTGSSVSVSILSNAYSGLISFKIVWFDLFVIEVSLKSLLQHHCSKTSVFWLPRCKKICIKM